MIKNALFVDVNQNGGSGLMPDKVSPNEGDATWTGPGGITRIAARPPRDADAGTGSNLLPMSKVSVDPSRYGC